KSDDADRNSNPRGKRPGSRIEEAQPNESQRDHRSRFRNIQRVRERDEFPNLPVNSPDKMNEQAGSEKNGQPYKKLTLVSPHRPTFEADAIGGDEGKRYETTVQNDLIRPGVEINRCLHVLRNTFSAFASTRDFTLKQGPPAVCCRGTCLEPV